MDTNVAISTDADTEVIWRSHNFEGVPHGGEYAIVHRDTGIFATTCTYSAQEIAKAMETIERGYCHGVNAIMQTIISRTEALTQGLQKELFGTFSGAPKRVTRPKKKV